MKFVRNLILTLALFLPSISLAEESACQKSDNYYCILDGFSPTLWGWSIGGGPYIVSGGIDFVIGASAILYETARPDSLIGFWEPTNELMWTNRIRLIYDFDNDQVGFYFQPNLRYMFENMIFTVTSGPEIGWAYKTGFDYGWSVRIGGLAGLGIGSHEFGYLINSKKVYYTFSLDITLGFLAALSI